MASDTRVDPIYRASLPYVVAIGSVVLAVAVRLLVDPLIGNDFPFATIFLAILLTAWFGGFRPALLAVVCGAIGSALFLFPDRFSLNVRGRDMVLVALTAYKLPSAATIASSPTTGD